MFVFVWIWVELQPETRKREKRVYQLWKKISTATKERKRNWNKMKKVILCCHGYLALFNDPLFLKHWLYGVAEIDTVGLYRISNWINWKCDLDCYIQLISAPIESQKTFIIVPICCYLSLSHFVFIERLVKSHYRRINHKKVTIFVEKKIWLKLIFVSRLTFCLVCN